MPKDDDGNPMKIGIIPSSIFNLLNKKVTKDNIKHMPTLDGKPIPYKVDKKEYTESELQALYNWTLIARDDPSDIDALNTLEFDKDPITIDFTAVAPGDVMFRKIDYGSKVSVKGDETTIGTETGRHMIHELSKKGDPKNLPAEIGSVTFGMIRPQNIEFNSYLDFMSQNIAYNPVGYQSATGRSLLGGASITGTTPMVTGNNP